MISLVETVVTFLTAFTGFLGAAVALNQLTDTTRLRRSVEFWENRIQSSKNDVDQFAFTVLHREDLSKLVAKSWVRIPRGLVLRGYLWVFGVAMAAWLGYSLSTSERAESLGIGLGSGEIFPLSIAGYFAILSFMAEFYSSWFLFRLQRSRARLDYLRGREPLSLRSPYGDMHALQILIGKSRVVLGMFFLAIATFSAASTVAYIAAPGRDASYEWVPLVTIPMSFVGFLLGSELGIKYIIRRDPDVADFYPIHGDDERAAEIDKRITKRIEEQKSRKEKSPRWLRKNRADPPEAGRADSEVRNDKENKDESVR